MAMAFHQQRRNDPARWDPFSELERFRADLSRFPENWSELAPLLEQGFTPLADVEETDDAYLIEVEVPGVDKKDVDISMSGRRLTISGERKEKERVGILRRRTRAVGRFNLEIVLPEDIDSSNVTASLEGGELIVRVPKASSEHPRHIEVS